jgi:hypothetical protein
MGASISRLATPQAEAIPDHAAGAQLVYLIFGPNKKM